MEIGRAAVDDRDGDDAGYLIGMLSLGAVHDLREEAAPGAQGDAALDRVVDLALPTVDGADRWRLRSGVNGSGGRLRRDGMRRRCWSG